MNISELLGFISRHKWKILGGGLFIGVVGVLTLVFFSDYISLPGRITIVVLVVNSIVDPLVLVLLQQWQQHKKPAGGPGNTSSINTGSITAKRDV